MPDCWQADVVAVGTGMPGLLRQGASRSCRAAEVDGGDIGHRHPAHSPDRQTAEGKPQSILPVVDGAGPSALRRRPDELRLLAAIQGEEAAMTPLQTCPKCGGKMTFSCVKEVAQRIHKRRDCQCGYADV